MGAHRCCRRRRLGVSILIAVPLGVVLGHLHRGSFIAVNLANIGRALPTLVVIAFGIAFLGIGFTNVLIALVVLGVPPILTNAYVAVDEVDPDAVEAARGMGMTPLQVLRRVEVPLALPLIFAGIRTAGGLHRRHGDHRSDRRRRRAGRDPRQPGDLWHRGAGRRGALRLAPCACGGCCARAVIQRAVTPRGLKLQVPAFEPDVRPVV